MSGEAMRDFIPGVYVRNFSTEFAVGSDTLEVSLPEGDVYVLEKRSGFQRVLNGRLGVAEWRTEKWVARWDAEQGLLYEQQKGKVVQVRPEKKQLLVGASVYVKID